MHTIAALQYYRCRALYLQYKYGDLVNIDLNSPVGRTLKDPQIGAWQTLHRRISQDAFAELIQIEEEVTRTHPGLFLRPSGL